MMLSFTATWLLCFQGAPATGSVTRDRLFTNDVCAVSRHSFVVSDCLPHVSNTFRATAWSRFAARSRRVVGEHDRIASRPNEPASPTGGLR